MWQDQGRLTRASPPAQGCVLTCALDGTVKVWQFVPDAARDKGARVDTTPVYIHPPEDEGAPGRNTQARSCGLRLARRPPHASSHPRRKCHQQERKEELVEVVVGHAGGDVQGHHMLSFGQRSNPLVNLENPKGLPRGPRRRRSGGGVLALAGGPDAGAKPVLLTSHNDDGCVRLWDLPQLRRARAPAQRARRARPGRRPRRPPRIGRQVWEHQGLALEGRADAAGVTLAGGWGQCSPAPDGGLRDSCCKFHSLPCRCQHGASLHSRSPFLCMCISV